MNHNEKLTNYKNNDMFYERRLSENSANRIIKSHTHEIYEIILLKQGKITYSVEGKNYNLKQNSIIFTRPHKIHSIIIKEDIYERYDLVVDFSFIPKNFYKNIPADLDVINCDGNRYLLDLFEKFDYYIENTKEEVTDRVIKNLVMEILYNINIAAELHQNQNKLSINPIIKAATLYIDQNFTTLQSIDEICNKLFITKSHLHHLFTKHLQTSPKQYIILKRLVLAQNKIRRGAKATEIYQECGFNDYTTFFRSYVKHFGYPPSKESGHKIKLEIK